jgi:hypothetical protein
MRDSTAPGGEGFHEARRSQISAERQGEGPIPFLTLNSARSREDALVPVIGFVDELLVLLDQLAEAYTHPAARPPPR